MGQDRIPSGVGDQILKYLKGMDAQTSDRFLAGLAERAAHFEEIEKDNAPDFEGVSMEDLTLLLERYNQAPELFLDNPHEKAKMRAIDGELDKRLRAAAAPPPPEKLSLPAIKVIQERNEKRALLIAEIEQLNQRSPFETATRKRREEIDAELSSLSTTQDFTDMAAMNTDAEGEA